MSKCAGCSATILNREYLICSKCKNKYDIGCANVPRLRFQNTMSVEYRDAWICKKCNRAEYEKINSTAKPSTAVAARAQEPALNMTLRPRIVRKRYHRSENKYDTSDDEYQSLNEQSVLGDTLNATITSLNEDIPANTQHISLEEFKKILDEKFEANKHIIISEMQCVIQREIKEAISKFKTDILQRTNTISSEQATMKKDILQLNNKIKTLETENAKLQGDLKYIQTAINNHQNNNSNTQNKPDCLGKKIVLHGLEELYGETEDEVHERILYIFRDIMNVNLHGHIEELRRIGRRGNRRPLVIELISKNVTKHLLNNSEYFNYSGLTITEYLDENSMKIRRNLINSLREARREGQHAIIRNNKLIINGKVQSTTSVLSQENRTTIESTHEPTNNEQYNQTEKSRTTINENIEEHIPPQNNNFTENNHVGQQTNENFNNSFRNCF